MTDSFPNQDKLAGKGLGNLIALPFYKPAMNNGNSCFMDPETMEPQPDQWQFLTTIQRVQTTILDFLNERTGTTALAVNAIPNQGLTIAFAKATRIPGKKHLNALGIYSLVLS